MHVEISVTKCHKRVTQYLEFGPNLHAHTHLRVATMSHNSSGLKIPLTFSLQDKDGQPLDYAPIDGSFASSSFTTLCSIAEGSTAVVGCDDGTSYLLARPFRAPAAPPVDFGYSPRPTSPMRLPSPGRPSFASRSSQSTSRASSPTSMHQAPFNVTTRSRVVTEVSNAQVEAPKNYVDFDDEPDKLKGMLKSGKGKASKERESVDSNGEERPSTQHTKQRPRSPPPRKRKEDPRSLLSATNSPLYTPKSIPASPRTTSFSTLKEELRVISHIIPPSRGAEHPVSAIEPVEGGHIVAILQQSG